MTWLKLSDDYHDLCAGLSDAAYRTHTEALGWCMRKENAGHITRRDVHRFAETTDPWPAVTELVARGFWIDHGDETYRVAMHMEWQPEPEVLTARRKSEAERQKRKRQKAAGLDEDQMSRRDYPRDDTRDPGRDGTGRGKASQREGG